MHFHIQTAQYYLSYVYYNSHISLENKRVTVSFQTSIATIRTVHVLNKLEIVNMLEHLWSVPSLSFIVKPWGISETVLIHDIIFFRFDKHSANCG
jgi:hypothetical protein